MSAKITFKVLAIIGYLVLAWLIIVAATFNYGDVYILGWQYIHIWSPDRIPFIPWMITILAVFALSVIGFISALGSAEKIGSSSTPT